MAPRDAPSTSAARIASRSAAIRAILALPRNGPAGLLLGALLPTTIAAAALRLDEREKILLKTQIASGAGARVILVDSITKVTPEDAGAIVVCGSHGGASAAEFALAVPLAAVFFNDAGVGKDDAGIVALDLLQAKGVAAGALAHASARIGDAQDMWDHGVISYVNAGARALGLAPGTLLRTVLTDLVSRPGERARDPTEPHHERPAACDAYYGTDLAWVHHSGYSHHVRNVHPGIVALLHEAGLRAGARVLDVGCGSGLLARELIAAGFRVHGVDASPAMIELARACAPGGTFDVLRLPTGLATDVPGGLPGADAVVSTGHALNYLDTRDAIAQALAEVARAVRPGGVIALDLMTEAFCELRAPDELHAKVEDDWTIVTRFSRPAPFRFDRRISVFRRIGDRWRRSDEHHRNVTFDADDAARILRDCGIDAGCRTAFGAEALPRGLVVLVGTREPR